MLSDLEYAKYIVKSLNLINNNVIEIVTPKECESFAYTIRSILDSKHLESYITYTNASDDYYIQRDSDFYKELVDRSFIRITIYSSFVDPKNNHYYNNNSKILRYPMLANKLKHTMVVYPSKRWADIIGVDYYELKRRIFELSFSSNRLDLFIDKLELLQLKSAHVKTGLGTDLKLSFTKDFRFNGAFIKSSQKTRFRANIPSCEIFTSPLKYSVNGTVVGSKPVYINNHIIPRFKLEIKDGLVISSVGLDSILNIDESLKYVGEFGISPYNEYVFYNTLLDENTATHIALGNAYYMGIKDSEKGKINRSNYHIDLPFGTSDMIIEFYDEFDRLVCLFKDNTFKFLEV